MIKEALFFNASSTTDLVRSMVIKTLMFSLAGSVLSEVEARLGGHSSNNPVLSHVLSASSAGINRVTGNRENGIS